MKLTKIVIISSLMVATSSCAFFNERTVDVGINSVPNGADIIIEGRNYGKTPAILKLEPKKYNIVLNKEGYGSTNFSPEIWWGTVRTDINGNRTADGTRCFFDMMSLVFSFNAYNAAKCGDFKEKQYMITIPQTSSRANNTNSNFGEQNYYNRGR